MLLRAILMPGLAAFSALVLPPADRAADRPVDVELVLAVDISDSMDADEQALQRRGYRSALTDRRILEAVAGGRWGRIAVTYVEWAGPSTQRIVVPWAVIDGAASAARFARRLEGPTRTFNDGTAIGAALAFSGALLDRNRYAGARRVVDVSGDGVNNAGPPVAPVRDALAARGITVNGLPILARRGASAYSIPDLATYYRDCVTGGTGAFTIAIDRFDAFDDAILRKLALEIAGRAPPARILPVSAAPSDDCTIGERMGGPAQPGPGVTRP